MTAAQQDALVQRAYALMLGAHPELAAGYAQVVRLLLAQPDKAATLRGKSAPPAGSDDYFARLSVLFAQARQPTAPQKPTTIPDSMVTLILQHYFGVPAAHLAQAQDWHLQAMAAENLVGGLLERYLASVLEPLGWVWCSGSVVKAVDFILPPPALGADWRLLQVKNRDNSENSSSSAIRHGTPIEKWFRSFSRKAETNWAAFPDAAGREQLSEAGFQTFVRNYLHGLPQPV